MRDDVAIGALNTWTSGVQRKYGPCSVYLVGSAIANPDRTPRDWDVRLVLADSAFAQRYGLSPAAWKREGDTGDWSEARWSWAAECAGLALAASELMGVEVDFQVQPQSYASRQKGPAKELGVA
jgi:hypothetical protein